MQNKYTRHFKMLCTYYESYTFYLIFYYFYKRSSGFLSMDMWNFFKMLYSRSARKWLYLRGTDFLAINIRQDEIFISTIHLILNLLWFYRLKKQWVVFGACFSNRWWEIKTRDFRDEWWTRDFISSCIVWCGVLSAGGRVRDNALFLLRKEAATWRAAARAHVPYIYTARPYRILQ